MDLQALQEWLTRTLQGLDMKLSQMDAAALANGCAVLALCWLGAFVTSSKVRLAHWGVWYFLASADKKTRKPNDDKFDFADASLDRRTIIFIRHGESEWNYIFNKGFILLRPFRLLVGLVREALMIFDSGSSLFYDSPLSATGIKQAQDLLTFVTSQPPPSDTNAHRNLPAASLDTSELLAIVRGERGKSVVVSSILRRAISTGLIGLAPRLLRDSTKAKVELMTSLQEISRNVDTLSLTPRQALPAVPSGEKTLRDVGSLIAHFYKERLSPKLNSGNKKLSQKAVHRQDDFIKWAFIEQSADVIIVCGHSLWFREFFRSFLAKGTAHVAKEKKMVNCGIVAFDLYATNGATKLRIDPSSVKSLYGGFEVAKGKAKKLA